MTGAAGGLSGGLWAAFGAELQAGAPFVLDAVEFDRRLRRARAVVTGEGKLDEQSLAGKAHIRGHHAAPARAACRATRSWARGRLTPSAPACSTSRP